jgi:hypothetical protein
MVTYFALVTSADGDLYETREYRRFQSFEKALHWYRSAPDCARADTYKRFEDGTSEFMGSFKRLAPVPKRR